MTTSGNGQAWSSTNDLSCPNDPRGQGIDDGDHLMTTAVCFVSDGHAQSRGVKVRIGYLEMKEWKFLYGD